MEILKSDTIDFILGEIKIDQVISQFVNLRRRGTNFLGQCPFHSETIPSFVVSDSKQIYKCFGCGKSGNAISFVMEIKKCNLKEAIDHISSNFKLQLPNEGGITETSTYGYDGNSISNTILKPIKLNFNSNINSIREFLTFDKILLDFCITQIEKLDERIRNNEEIQLTNLRLLPTDALNQLKSIRQNNSFKSKYETLNNQSLVLLISYFTSALKDIFKESLEYLALNKREVFKSVEIDFKISLQELGEYDFNLTKSIGDIIIRKKDISFQDMQSIVREFKNYLSIEIEKNELVDNIILAQASRHSIVHSLGIADEKFMRQIANATKRTLKQTIRPNDEIVFSITEIEKIILDLKTFIDNLTKEISLKFEHS